MLRKLQLLFLVSTVALAAAIAFTIPISASAAETPAQVSDGIKIVINGSEFEPQSAAFIDDGSIYLPVRDMGELLGTVVFWNFSSKIVTMTYPELIVKLNYGSTKATVNGNVIQLTAPLRIVQDRMFAPLRFFSEATGAGVEWNSSTKTVNITQSDDYVKGIGINSTIWLNRRIGDLYIAHPFEQFPVHVGKLNADIHDYVSIDVWQGNSGNMIVTVLDNYGEPHINYNAYGILVHDNKIVSQKKASYFQRYEKNVTYYQYLDQNANMWVENILLTDGRTLTVFNTDGKTVQEYDLPALAGKDENYAVLGAGEDYLVVRPNRTGLLTLINLADHSTVEMCKKLLTGKDLDYALNNDVPYHGDELIFSGELANGLLVFWYDSPFDGKDNKYERLTYNRNTGDVGTLANISAVE
ncbi:MAG: copper amine oxidase N-terminal domain-containing protein [Dehalobacterium sp.]